MPEIWLKSNVILSKFTKYYFQIFLVHMFFIISTLKSYSGFGAHIARLFYSGQCLLGKFDKSFCLSFRMAILGPKILVKSKNLNRYWKRVITLVFYHWKRNSVASKHRQYITFFMIFSLHFGLYHILFSNALPYYLNRLFTERASTQLAALFKERLVLHNDRTISQQLTVSCRFSYAHAKKSWLIIV